MDSYLSEMFPAPDRLDELAPYIGSLAAYYRRSAHRDGQRRAALLAGSSVQENFAARVCQVFTSFPDARAVARTVPAINLYLSRLIASDELADARDVFRECLEVQELVETATSLKELADLDPEIATALLELRCGRATRLFAERASDLVDRELAREIGIYRFLVEEIARIRITYSLRGEAMKAGAQIHCPFNLAALDGLDKAKSAGTLCLFTLVGELKHNLHLLKHALDLYGQTSHKPVLSGLLVQSPIIGHGSVIVKFAGLNLSADTRAFEKVGIEGRARVQLALWRAVHGEELESVLASAIENIGEYVTRLEQRLADVQAKWAPNKIVGNLNRADAGARLYQAVAEAVAWTAEPIPPKEDKDYLDKGAYSDPSLNPLAIAIQAVTRSSPNQRAEIPVPARRKEHQPAIDELFAAMRLAFLQDDEALPSKLREVKDRRTGKTVTIKFHQRIADIRGKKYTFSRLWKAYKEQDRKTRRQQLSRATSKERWEAKRPRSTASRGADRSRRPGGVLPRGLHHSRDALRGAVVQGFVAR